MNDIPESSQSFDSTSFFKCGTLALINYISTLDIYLLFYVYIRMYIVHQYLYCDCLFPLFFASAFQSVAKFQVRQDVECRSRESLQPSQEVGDLPS